MAIPKTPTQQISGLQRNAEKYQQRHFSEAQDFKRANRAGETDTYTRDESRKSPFSTPMTPFKEAK